MTPTPRSSPVGRNAVVALVLLVGFVVGVALVVLGGDDPAPTSTTSVPATTAAPGGDDERLEFDDEISEASLPELAGIVVPADASEFLTARLDDDTQLDVTFTLPPGSVDEFLDASALPPTTPDDRLILHSSPLWRLNPEPDQPLRSTGDETDRVRRAVELVDEGPETVRVRITITPS